jgi:hypothetical protein
MKERVTYSVGLLKRALWEEFSTILEYRTMDKLKKPNDSVCYAP